MKWLGEKPFHRLLLLTEKPAQWPAWALLPLPVLLAFGTGLLWATAVDAPVLGWVAALGLLLAALADWALLAALPRRALSFGPVQPPWLGLTISRWLLAMAAVPFAARWPIPTLVILFTLQAGLWLLMAYGTCVEPFRLQVSQVEITSGKLANPGLPLRIVQLSDLHVERLTHREHALDLLLSDLAPDLIVLTGDFLSTSYNDDPRALADLRELLGGFSAAGGIYAVWGTAEVDLPHLLRPLLAELGVIPLEDQAVEVAAGGHPIWLMGVSCSRDPVADGARLRALLEDAPPDVLTVLLYHTPDLMPQAASLGVDLYLAGHTHGGQWCLPGFGAILTSSRYWKCYEAGLYREGDTHLYVSQGVGMEGFGMPRARFFCPPELVQVIISGARVA
jgi:predicted MPP superfamily phosphohydrolase